MVTVHSQDPIREDHAGSSLTDVAVETIRGWIVEGQLAPGEPLTENALAGRLGMSRVPVREALQRLREQGLVQVPNGRWRSAEVWRPTLRDVTDLLDVRAQLESLVCRRAAERRTDADLARLDDIMLEGRAAVEQENWAAAGQANLALHRRLAAMSGNRHLCDAIDRLGYRLAWIHVNNARLRGMDAWDEHASLIDAVRNEDADEAAAIGLAHILANVDLIVEDYLRNDNLNLA
jgi:DNA-binding GntR family transcriptional regulator